MFLISILALVCIVSVFFPSVSAELTQLYEQVTPLNPHVDVLTAFYYPDLATSSRKGKPKKLPVGEDVTILAHFANEGRTNLNVSGIMGTMSLSDNFHNSVVKFALHEVGYSVEPHEEVTISYVFHIPMWVPNDKKYKIAHTLYYEEVDQSRRYASTIQNTTIKYMLMIMDLLMVKPYIWSYKHYV